MPGVRTAVTLNDQMTAGFLRMAEAIKKTCKGFESMQKISSRAVDTENLEDGAEALKKQAQQAENVTREMAGVAEATKEAAEGANELNNNLNNSVNTSSNLLGKLLGVAKALGSMYVIKKTVDFLKDCFDLYNAQLRAERQLQVSMENMGASAEDYYKVIAKAQEIQSKGMYGDEAMIGAAGEFATYFSDADAITTMMDTLTNYAAGMSLGEEVGMEEMVNYATNLGKIATGSYDAMTKKGFEFTEAQKAVIDGTATEAQYVEVLGDDYLTMSEDMRTAAAVANVIDANWANLYATMSNTPTGKIAALKNAWGDLKETIGGGLVPAIVQFATIATRVITGLTKLVQGLKTHWGQIRVVIIMVGIALGVYAGYLAVVHAKTIALTIAEWAKIAAHFVAAFAAAMAAMAEELLAGATLKEAAATAQATMAQYGFNASIFACPIFWIIAGIIGIIAAITALVRHFNIFGSQSTSVMGTVVGLIFVAGAAVRNFATLVANIARLIVSVVQSCCNNIKAAFSMAINGVIGFFYRLLSVATSVIARIANALNKLPFVHLDTSGLTAAADNFAAKSAAAYDRAGEAANTLKGGIKGAVSNWAANKISYVSYTAAFQSGAAKVDGIGGAEDLGWDYGGGAGDLGDAVADIADNTGGGGSPAGQTAENTGKMADDMEDILEYMVDIAERETVNRFTTADIYIDQTNNNSIASGLDLDGIMEQWNDDFTEILQVAAEGVHV